MSTHIDPFAAGAFPVQISQAGLRKMGSFQSRSQEEWLALLVANISDRRDAAANVAITLSLDTAIYASGDVLADTQAVTGAIRSAGASAILQSLSLLDKDDNAAAGIDLVFLNANVSLGTENAAPNISDANAAAILGIVSLVSGDFIDVGGAKVASKANIGLLVTPATGTTIYVAAITRGTPTQSAAGIVLTLGVKQE